MPESEGHTVPQLRRVYRRRDSGEPAVTAGAGSGGAVSNPIDYIFGIVAIVWFIFEFRSGWIRGGERNQLLMQASRHIGKCGRCSLCGEPWPCSMIVSNP